MQGLGAEVDDAWYRRVSERVRLPRGPISSGSDRRTAEPGAEVAGSA
jgi:hypothetical protein